MSYTCLAVSRTVILAQVLSATSVIKTPNRCRLCTDLVLLVGCPVSGHGSVQLPVTGPSLPDSLRSVLSFRSFVRLYAWPVAECCAVISPSHQRRCRCRDLQTSLVPHKVMGGNRFSMLSSSTERYYTRVSCSHAAFMSAVLRLIVH